MTSLYGFTFVLFLNVSYFLQVESIICLILLICINIISSGTSASDTHFQAYLLEGLVQWN